VTFCTLVTKAGNMSEAKAMAGVIRIIILEPIANSVTIFKIWTSELTNFELSKHNFYIF
jgi:hypothetical protein